MRCFGNPPKYSLDLKLIKNDDLVDIAIEECTMKPDFVLFGIRI